jgi:uncharacterized membrane protein
MVGCLKISKTLVEYVNDVVYQLSLLLPKYIPSDLIGLSVQLIPAILHLQFFSLPIHTPSALFLFNRKRNLSIVGNKLIIESLILPLFTFLASVCLVPDTYHKEIEKKCFKFIWNGKPDKVKKKFPVFTNCIKIF